MFNNHVPGANRSYDVRPIHDIQIFEAHYTKREI